MTILTEDLRQKILSLNLVGFVAAPAETKVTEAAKASLAKSGVSKSGVSKSGGVKPGA